jgi:hypothetical protein
MQKDSSANRVMKFLVGPPFWVVHRYWPRLESPRSFSEKIFHRMLFDRNPLWTMLSDKLCVRDYVTEKIGKEYLIPLLWTGEKPEEVPFAYLPDKYVIKTNHGCGYNIIIKDKTQIDQAKISIQLKKWLSENFGQDIYLGISWAYKGIKPRLMVEEFLDEKGKPPLDYKFFCFAGKVEYVLMTFDRHEHPYEKHFDRNFIALDLWNGCRQYPNPVEKPPEYEKMVSIAETLAKDFDFVRIDLYNLAGRIYFGEYTCYPAGGLARFIPRKYDFIFGEHWKMI